MEIKYEYEMEELFPILEKLSKKYTSNESSSITYETAQVLMGAILFCINEYYQTECLAYNSKKKYSGNVTETVEEKTSIKNYGKVIDVQKAYQMGYEAVIEKVKAAYQIYEEILDLWDDYGCRSCSDTILKGMPQFFLKYDPQFNPQNHILTLDYCVLGKLDGFEGINLIYEYLICIKKEWTFLRLFESEKIRNLLLNGMQDYKTLFLGNIVEEVLIVAIGCIIAEKSIELLELDRNDIIKIKDFFEEDNLYLSKLFGLIKQVFNQCEIKKLLNDAENKEDMIEYFSSLCNDYAVRIGNGMEHNSLHIVFHTLD